MSKKILLTGQASDAQIAEWKAKYKYGIYALEVDGHVGYFKNPGRNELNFAMSKAETDKVLNVYEELANVTFIGGSREMLEDDQMFIGISQELRVKLEGKKGYPGKLIAGSRGGPERDPMGYLETLLEYYLPGLEHHSLSDEAFAQKLAHVQYIRKNIVNKT